MRAMPGPNEHQAKMLHLPQYQSDTGAKMRPAWFRGRADGQQEPGRRHLGFVERYQPMIRAWCLKWGLKLPTPMTWRRRS